MEKHCSTISFGLKNRKDKNGKSPIVMLIGAYGERAEFQTDKKLKLKIGTMVSYSIECDLIVIKSVVIHSFSLYLYQFKAIVVVLEGLFFTKGVIEIIF